MVMAAGKMQGEGYRLALLYLIPGVIAAPLPSAYWPGLVTRPCPSAKRWDMWGWMELGVP